MKKICILGNFGEGKYLSNGQTVKTKIITEELCRKFGEEQVKIIDTYGGIKTLLKAPLHVIYALKNYRNVIIFPAHNGVRVYAPLLAMMKNLFKKRSLHYVVIGGWLPEFLKSRKLLTKALKKFDGIYAETNTMKTALEKQGFANIYVMPNCKKLDVLSENELVYPEGIPYRLCTFSRVLKEKGIETAVNAVKNINEKLGYTAYSLDIYGKIAPENEQWFEKIKTVFPQYVKYKGVVPFDKSVEVLKNYFALLFPTYYDGEGFAGTLIDAFSAGVPVIASDWRYNSEIVNENVGFVYHTGNDKEFEKILENVAVNPSMILNKKLCCLKEIQKYKTDNAIKILFDKIKDE